MQSELERILELEKETKAAYKNLILACDKVPLDKKGIKAAAKYYGKINNEYTKAYFKYKREHK